MHGTPARNLQLFKQLCGDNLVSNVVLVTTKGDMVDETRTRLVENELIEGVESCGFMIKSGTRLIQHTGDKESAMRIINSIIAGSTVNDLLLEYTTVLDDTVVPDKNLYLESGEPSGYVRSNN